MKKLLVLLFSILISFNSYGELIEVSSSNSSTVYIYNDSIRKHNGNILWWELTDYIRSDSYGNLSNQMYKEGDCGMYRHKVLSFVFYKQNMGFGDGETSAPIGKNGDWQYPGPGTVASNILRYVCAYID